MTAGGSSHELGTDKEDSTRAQESCPLASPCFVGARDVDPEMLVDTSQEGLYDCNLISLQHQQHY